MSDFIFSRDEHGAPRARAKDSALADLATFLESDIQDDKQTCIDLLGEIISIEQDDEPLEFIGNGWILSYDKRFAAIACHAVEDGEVIALPPEKVALAVKDWLEFIN
jgi:hypothetical protein